MTLATAITVTVVLLLLYYGATISYDLYMAKLAKANKDENNEETIDISDQVCDFSSVPVTDKDDNKTKERQFEDLICTGISTSKASHMMESAAEGTPVKELDNILHTIHRFHTLN